MPIEGSLSVLLVDDDAVDRELFIDAIGMAAKKYHVAEADNGEKALAYLNQTRQLPDLIILDKQLSGVDGLDICRHLKNKAETSHIFIVMTSATPHVARLAAAALADAFIEKPFNNVDLVENVKKLLS